LSLIIMSLLDVQNYMIKIRINRITDIIAFPWASLKYAKIPRKLLIA
jgi:hypothetical protein